MKRKIYIAAVRLLGIILAVGGLALAGFTASAINKNSSIPIVVVMIVLGVALFVAGLCLVVKPGSKAVREIFGNILDYFLP